MSTLKTSFHRTFPLQRAPLAEYIRALEAEGRPLSFDEIREKTSLGTVKVESMRRYARATGLTNAKDELSSLGKKLVIEDPYLSSSATAWILHAGMVKANTVAPEFWKAAWKSLRLGDELDRSGISELVATQEGSEQVNTKTAEEAASVFLTSYSKDECLGGLGILDKQSRGYRVEQIRVFPPLGVFAWFVAEQWEAIFPDQASVELNHFKELSGLAIAFKISPEKVDQMLEQLAENRLCDLFLSAPPYQIVRTWTSPSDLITKIYDEY